MGKARLPGDWRQAALRDEIAIVSVEPAVRRLTQDLASLRNGWVAALAHNIVIAHAEPACVVTLLSLCPKLDVVIISRSGHFYKS